MNQLIRAPLSTQLPATRCSKEMREQFEQIAGKEGVSLGEVQRAAFSLFLSEYATKCSNLDKGRSN